MFNITAPLQSVSVEYRGSSNFTVTTVRVNLALPGARAGEKPLDLKANGSEGDRIAALLADAPEGAFVRIFARPTFRQYNDNTYMDLEIVDCMIQGGFGTIDTSFNFQGFVMPLTQREGSREPFYIGEVGAVAFSRDGVVPEAKIDMIVPTDVISTWEAAEGKYAIVSGTINGYLSPKNNRAYPRFVASGLSGIMESPSWLSDYSPAETVPVGDISDVVPF